MLKALAADRQGKSLQRQESFTAVPEVKTAAVGIVVFSLNK